MKTPKIVHASVEVSYYPHLEGANLSAWVHREDRVSNYMNITRNSAKRVFALIVKLAELYPEQLPVFEEDCPF